MWPPKSSYNEDKKEFRHLRDTLEIKQSTGFGHQLVVGIGEDRSVCTLRSFCGFHNLDLKEDIQTWSDSYRKHNTVY